MLACLDGYMNVVMEQTEEYVDGQLQNKYGECFIRGNNGTVKTHHTPSSSALPNPRASAPRIRAAS